MDNEIKIEPNNSQTDVKNKSEVSEAIAPPTLTQKPSQSIEKDEQSPPKRKKIDFYNKTGKKSCVIDPESSTSNICSEVISKTTEVSHNIEFYLTVSNLPIDWTNTRIENYLKEECKDIELKDMLRMKNIQNGAVRLTFQSLDECKDVSEKLKDNIIEEKKIEIKITDSAKTLVSKSETTREKFDQEDVAQGTTEIEDNEPCTSGTELWHPRGLFGLRPQFLMSLNIRPPLDKWVHVSNFRCDKSELKEVMELAGNVLMCCVVSIIHKQAKIMYSHPLEAIQAISMLNGQMYYGKPLKVVLEKNPTNTLILPKGLSNIGLGLGLDGKPLRNVAQEYEKYLSHQSSFLNPVVFSNKHYNDEKTGNVLQSEEENEIEAQRKIDEFMASSKFETFNNQRSFKVKNVDELDNNSKDRSNRATPETNVPKDSDIQTKKSSVCSLSPSKNGVEKAKENSNKPPIKQLGPIGPASTQANQILGHSGAIRPGQLNPNTFSGANLSSNPQAMHSPRGSGYPNYGPGPANFPIPAQAGPYRPGPVAYVPLQGPRFGSQMPATFHQPVIRRQLSPANYNASRTFVGPNHVVPNMNPGNCLTVHIANATWMKQVYNEFKSPYVGMWVFWRPGLVINCPKLARNVLVKDHDIFRNRFLSSGKTDPIGGLNIFTVNTLCSDFTTDVIGEAAFGVSSETVKTGDSLMRRVTKEFANFNFHRGLCWSSIFFYPDLVDVFRREKLYQELIEAKQKNAGKDLDPSALAELTYSNCVIKEALLKFTSMGWLDRIASQDYQIDDHLTIPKGTVIYVNAVGMQQDAKHFPDPLVYDPDRFLPENERKINPYTFMPFGEGPRGCIGKRFGYQTVRCGLASIIMNYEIRALPHTPKPNDCHIEKNRPVSRPRREVIC